MNKTPVWMGKNNIVYAHSFEIKVHGGILLKGYFPELSDLISWSWSRPRRTTTKADSNHLKTNPVARTSMFMLFQVIIPSSCFLWLFYYHKTNN